MTQPPTQLERDLRDLDRLARGECAPAERAALHARLDAEPALAALRDEQAALESRLRRSFAPPVPPAVPWTEGGGSGGAGGGSTGGASGGGAGGASAGSLTGGLFTLLLSGPGLAGAVLVLGAVLAGAYFWLRPPAPEALPSTPAAAYAALERSGFTATFPESDPRQLSILISNKISHELVFAAGKDVEYVGVRTLPGGSPLRLGVLAKVRGRPVLVVLDVVGAASSTPDAGLPTSGGEGGLHAHHARLGQVDAVEITPWETPSVLALISAK